MKHIIVPLFLLVLSAICSCTKEPSIRFRAEKHIINTLENAVQLTIFDPSIGTVYYTINSKDTLVFSGLCGDNGDGRSCLNETFPENLLDEGDVSIMFDNSRIAYYGLSTCDSIGKNIATSIQVALGASEICGYSDGGLSSNNATIVQYRVDSVDYLWAR